MPDGVLENVPVIGAKKTFPRSFGRYILEKSLSRGGMGEVFLTVAKSVWKRCVIKTIRGDLTGDEEFIGRFADEAKIMMRIQHENIIRVFDAGKVGTDYYIAMEFVHGRDLGDVLDRAYERGEPMPTQLGLYVADKLLDGLDYAHKLTDEHGRHMGVVHRDISPQNVLIGFDGSVKLIDFGLARTDLLPARTQGALAVGKYGYMSPEQARHERIDGRADIYSTGVMLFEVFTGDRLVDEQDQATLWSRVLNPKHRKPSTVIPNLLKEIDELVMQAVAVKTEERYRDANEMRKFVSSLRTKESNREDFIRYLRYLYPKVDFNAPVMPDFGDQFQDSERSVIIATSREGAMSVFGRGELPIEWTTQIDAAELQAAFAKYRDRARHDYERDVTTDASIEQRIEAISEAPHVEATWVRSRAGTPDSREQRRSAGDHAATQIAEMHPIDLGTEETRYARAPATGVQAVDHSDTQHAQPALGTSRVGGAFRDDEMTVMMDAPPRNQIVGATRSAPAPSFLDEDTKDGDAPTRLSHAVPDTPSPTIMPTTRGRAIQEKVRGTDARTNLRDRDAPQREKERSAPAPKKDATRPPPVQQLRTVAHRQTVGTDGGQTIAPVAKKHEDTLPPVGDPEYTEPERTGGGGGLGVLPILIFVGLAVIAVLVYMLLQMK